MSIFTYDDFFTKCEKQLINDEREISLFRKFMPKQQTVNNILGYSKQLKVEKSKHLKYVEITLN